MSADHRKLEKLIIRYQRETGVTLDMKDVEEGCFPWHVHTTEDSSISLSVKRAICDAVMRLRRTREELVIVRDEMERLLAASSEVLHMLKLPLAVSCQTYQCWAIKQAR